MITLQQIISEFGEIPLCQCGCGHKVNIKLYRYNNYKINGYPKFIKGHSSKTPEAKENLRIKNTGNKNPNFEKIVSNETKEKMSIAQKENYKFNPERNVGKNNGMFGKIGELSPNFGLKRTKEQIENQRNGQLKRYQDPEEHEKTRQRMIGNKYNLGNKHKNETLILMSKQRSGEGNSNYNQEIHKTLEQIIQEFGEIPTCQCDDNCGLKVNVNPRYYTKYKTEGYPKFLPGHHAKGQNNPNFEKFDELSTNWKGGLTLLKPQIRQHKKSIDWRNSVFARDNYTCQQCGDNSGGNLEAHHIKQISTILIENNIITIQEAIYCNELFDINNGITLCKECHKLIPIYRN